jgi:hypothetical protein
MATEGRAIRVSPAMPVEMKEHSATQKEGQSTVDRQCRSLHRLPRMPSAVGLLLGGGASCVASLFRGGRAAGAAGRANLPVLDNDVLLIWS